MKEHIHLRRAITIIFILLIILVILPIIKKVGLYNTAFALNDVVTEADCRMCHCYNVSDTHHLLVEANRYECLNCHQIKWDGASQSYYTEIIRDCVACHENVVGTTHHLLAGAGSYTCLDCHMMIWDNASQKYIVDLNFTCITFSKSSNLPPIAYAGPYQTISAGQSVSFSGASSYDPDGSIIDYTWDFGDGSMSNGINTTHTYSIPGNYTVTLSVTDDKGAMGKGTTVVTVQSSGTNPALNCRSCHYDTTPIINYASTAIIHHNHNNTPIKCPSSSPYAACPTTGNYQCNTCHKLIWDSNSNTSKPEIIGDCTVCHGSVSHTAAHEHAKIDSITCQQCHKPNVVDEHASRSLSCNVCHSSTNQTVINAINKGKGTTGKDVFCYDCHGTTNHITAHDKAIIPYPDCGSCHATNVVTEHAKYSLNCSVCHKSADTVIQNVITRGSGTTGQFVYCADCHSGQSLGYFGNHVKQHDKTFMSAGACTTPSYATDVVTYHESISTSTNQIYCFRCHTSTNSTVISAINSGMAGNSVTCSSCHAGKCTPNQPPKAVIAVTPVQTVQVGQSVSFSGSGSSDPDGTIKSYAWNFGDGTTGTGVTALHTYTTAGIYTVTLTLTDDKGATGTATAKITVQAAPVSTSVYADQVLWIQNLKYSTSSDSYGSKTDITSRFKDNILSDTFTIYNHSDSYKVISMKLNKDSGSYSQVMISLYVKGLYDNHSQTIKIYPYKSDGNSINTSYYSTYTISKTGWTQIDLTSLASKMKGFGWMKFRITCTSTSLDVAEGNFIVK